MLFLWRYKTMGFPGPGCIFGVKIRTAAGRSTVRFCVESGRCPVASVIVDWMSLSVCLSVPEILLFQHHKK